jgi:hypothetical protein
VTSLDEYADDDDVDGFLDGLLQQAAAQKASTSTSSKTNPAASNPAATTAAASSRPSTPGASAAAAGLRNTGKQQQQHQKGSKSKPAWALSEQQQAEAAAAAAAAAEAAAAADEAAEERELLQFAEGLSWEQVVGQMDDEQLAAAFQVRRQRRQAVQQTLLFDVSSAAMFFGDVAHIMLCLFSSMHMLYHLCKMHTSYYRSWMQRRSGTT